MIFSFFPTDETANGVKDGKEENRAVSRSSSKVTISTPAQAKPNPPLSAAGSVSGSLRKTLLKATASISSQDKGESSESRIIPSPIPEEPVDDEEKKKKEEEEEEKKKKEEEEKKKKEKEEEEKKKKEEEEKKKNEKGEEKKKDEQPPAPAKTVPDKPKVERPPEAETKARGKSKATGKVMGGWL